MGEGVSDLGVEGVGALGGSGVGCEAFGEETGSSAGTSRLEMSSPSSASSAMVFPTGTFLVPSGAYATSLEERNI